MMGIWNTLYCTMTQICRQLVYDTYFKSHIVCTHCFFFQIMKCSFSRPSPCFGKTVSRWYCIQNVQVCLHANILSYRQQYVLFMTLLSWNEHTSKCNIQIILSIYHKTPPPLPRQIPLGLLPSGKNNTD